MAAITPFSPKRLDAATPLEAGAAYFWRMARGMHDARRAGNEALASECAEALELVVSTDDYAALRTAAFRALDPLPLETSPVILKFPVAPAPRCGRRRQSTAKVRRRA
jgi:hypothetical protein